MLRNRGCTAGLIVFGVLAVVFLIGLDLYTELVWFDSLGLASVLWRRVGFEWLLFAIAWFVAAAVLAANWWLALRWAGGGHLTIPWLQTEQTQHELRGQPTIRVVSGRATTGLLVTAAAIFGFLFAQSVRRMWLAALMSLKGVPFGQSDPVLGRDLGYFAFRLPMLQFVQGWLLWLVAIALAGAFLLYLASYSAGQVMARVQIEGLRQPWLRLPPAGERHLLALGAVALLLLAWGYQLRIPDLLYSTSGAAYGAGYTDVHARLPVMHLLTAIVVLGAATLLASMFVRLRWLPYAAVGAWLLVAFLGGSVYPNLIQRFSVVPNELTREREYIGHTIAFTRAAFGLSDVGEADFDVVEEAPPLDLVANASTIKNIRLWDYRPLMRTYGQLQEIRLYYSFSDVDVDRYRLGDDYRQVTLAVREITLDELPPNAQTWVNRHLVYTHGSGLVLSPVNEVVEEGLPNLWVRDIPPRSKYPELALTRPEIYYGELTRDYVIVRTQEQELDYPSGDQNVYTSYAGKGGVLLDSPLKRLAYAIRLGSNQILLSDAITQESRLLWRRAIQESVQAVAPFLRYDADPYPVIVDGRLVWIIDAYTISERYPYSEPIATAFGPINYIRNSVKVTMDAYDGTLAFHLIEPDDPVAATYAAIFPDLFQPVEEMDPALVEHWRYPEGMFRVQAAKFQTFHMTDPQVFYNQEDLWNWAEEVVTGERVPIEPYYVNMRLPGEAEPEFVLMLPFTPSTKQNMVSWLYARNDSPNYGQLSVYKFPKQRLVYGPMQVESRIDQDPVISQQLSLWDQRGSQVIRGNLLVIPMDRAILYVEPIYLQAEASQLPELRRIIVAYGNRIAMAETLAQGLAQVMTGDEASGAEAPVDEQPSGETGDTGLQPEPQTPGSEFAEMILEADAHYQAAQDCLLTGNWTCYGAEMEALEQALDELVKATQQ